MNRELNRFYSKFPAKPLKSATIAGFSSPHVNNLLKRNVDNLWKPLPGKGLKVKNNYSGNLEVF